MGDVSIVQRLPTTGARGVCPFAVGGDTFLAVAQGAEDIAGRPASMSGGNSNIQSPVYRWESGSFVLDRWLPVYGCDDIQFFEIEGRRFLATAGLRQGAGPYDFNTTSTIFEWKNGAFLPLQYIKTFAAKQWRQIEIEGRHFLALAQGIDGNAAATCSPRSAIFEWNGTKFVRFQEIQSEWGYNWRHFSMRGEHYLAYADHVSPSCILKWMNGRFDLVAELDKVAGRAFCVFEEAGEVYLAFANLAGDSPVFRWHKETLVLHQTLLGPGMREFATAVISGRRRFILVRFIGGTRNAPVPSRASEYCVWDRGQIRTVDLVETSGATDASFFEIDACAYVAISNSLTPDLRFKTNTCVYCVTG